MLPFKLDARRNLALKLRDVYGISSADMVVIKSLSDCLHKATMLKKARLTDKWSIHMKKLQILIIQRMQCQLRLDRFIPLQDDRVKRDRYKFTDFVNYNFSELFKFRSPEALQRLYEGLPLLGDTKIQGYKTSG